MIIEGIAYDTDTAAFVARNDADPNELESTVRYLGIEVDDALAISEQVEL
jgi:hypothetical protein